MVTPLLQTKLNIPRVRPELVPRPRLVERLDEGLRLGRQLTLLSAPAGFGKTTLLSEWAAGSGRPVAWLSLDEGDDDPIRFVAYLVAALQAIPSLGSAGVGDSVRAVLQATRPPPAEAILAALINELAALPAPFIVVLDDYHRVQAQPVHDALTFLLDHLPPPMHLVIATRADPPLPVARLRGRGRLTELRQRDLRFTPEEAAEFLNQVMGLNLSATEVAALESRTEGWIVGLQLAALSLRDRDDAYEFITAFSGGHHYVLEYLVEEVLRRQPEPVRRFLMQTSILERLSGPLCDALTQGNDGEAMLAHLWHSNLFILPLDDDHYWYRYHHLFADLLGNLLRRDAAPEHIRELHRRACAWHDRNGLPSEAMRHALAAQDLDRAAELIERHSLEMVTHGELATLLRWIGALPEEVARSRPWLCIHQAWPLTFAGDADAAEPLLRQVERRIPSGDLTPEGEELLGNVAAMRAFLAGMRGDMSHALELAHRADALLPPDNLVPRNIVPYIVGSAHYAEGEMGAAREALAEELRIGREAGNLWTMVRSLCDLADVEIVQGRLRRATDLCREALHLAEERGARRFGTVGYVLVKLGDLLHERGDVAAAKDRALEGVELMQGWQQPFEMVSGYTILATIHQAQRDAEGALEALRKAERIEARHPHYAKVTSMARVCRINLCLEQDGPEHAARRALEARLGETGPSIFREQERIALARVLVAQGRPEKTLDLLTPMAKGAEAGGRFGRLIAILALEALAWQQRGDVDRALAALTRALEIGKPEGYVRAFVQHGEPMAALLTLSAAVSVAPTYVSGLVAALGADRGERDAAPPSPRPSPLIEPLTDRELEVLQLIARGHSNEQIAEALVVTLNTVKKHTSNIYGKLGVHSRTQAVIRAQELYLLQ